MGVILFLLAALTLGLSNIVLAFLFNKLYIKDLVADGFKVRSVKTGSVEAVATGLGISLPTLSSTITPSSAVLAPPSNAAAPRRPDRNAPAA